MNRCMSSARTPCAARRSWGRTLLGALSLVLISAPTWAQWGVRNFPANTERGALVVTQPPEVLINGKPERLSPGARIRATNNLLVLSGTLVGQNLLVNFVREPQGMVHEVWILTEAEAALPLPKQP